MYAKFNISVIVSPARTRGTTIERFELHHNTTSVKWCTSISPTHISPLAAKMSIESEKLTQRKRYKLMFKKTGPFKIVATNPHTVTIDEDGLHNTVSID